MADKKISALPAATTPLAGTEVLPIVQSGATVKVAVSDLTAGRAVSGTSITASTGNFIIGTAGAGIDFSVNPAAAGMTSELLNDYEQGTWTPTLTFNNASVGVTYDTTYTGGTYTKIGNRVFVTGYMNPTAKGSSTGTARIGGLPFTSSTGNKLYLGASLAASFGVTFSGQIGLTMDPNTSAFVFVQSTEAGGQNILTNTAFADLTYFNFSGHYTTA